MDDAKKQRRTRIKASLKNQGEYKFETPEAEKEAAYVVAEAEKELEECHVNFRWQREQLDLVKQAAAQIGVPYQTYIKLCVFRQAKQDLGITSSDAASKAELESLRNLVSNLNTMITQPPIGANVQMLPPQGLSVSVAHLIDPRLQSGFFRVGTAIPFYQANQAGGFSYFAALQPEEGPEDIPQGPPNR